MLGSLKKEVRGLKLEKETNNGSLYTLSERGGRGGSAEHQGSNVALQREHCRVIAGNSIKCMPIEPWAHVPIWRWNRWHE